VRVLLDECLPRRLKRELVGHDARTAPEMGWASKRNGELLALAVGQFEVLLTADRNLSYQQDVSSFDIAIVVLVAGSNRFEDLRSLTPRLLEVLPIAQRRVVTMVGAYVHNFPESVSVNKELQTAASRPQSTRGGQWYFRNIARAGKLGTREPLRVSGIAHRGQGRSELSRHAGVPGVWSEVDGIYNDGPRQLVARSVREVR
jgi:hypothetical protein